jgi:hypothetical protein
MEENAAESVNTWKMLNAPVNFLYTGYHTGSLLKGK